MRPRHRIAAGITVTVTVACAVALAGCSSSSSSEEHVLNVTGMTFVPRQLTIDVGDTVTWIVDDPGRPHEIVAADHSFESEMMDEGSYSHTFEQAGVFEYTCTPHHNMTGTIIVSG